MFNDQEYTRFRDHRILTSTVGFFKPRPGGFTCSGSGTFVSIGKVRGIVTCAHALEALKDQDRIDLAIFPVRDAQRLIPLNVREHCASVQFGPSETEDGPDLAFLKLPESFFGSIGHLVSTKSMELGRTHAFAQSEPSEKSVTVVTGMIADWTPEMQSELPFTVSGLMSVGQLTERMKSGEHDYFRFRPEPDADFRPPPSYKGTSGGGLWRIYPKPNDGGETAYRLIGVAFYETGDGQIVCHGQASLYVRLLDAVRDRWPEAQ